MSAPSILDPLLARPVTFADVLAALYDARFTGAVTIHFLHGTAIVVEAPPLDPPTKIRLQRPVAVRSA